MSLLPVDLTEIMVEELRKGQRDDGLLHASSHLIGSLRHTQLELAGAPTVERPFGDEMTLHIGTMAHRWLEDVLRDLGLPFMAEVNLNPWLPKGWGGTADIVMYNPDFEAFVLVDVKTTKGESIRWRNERGPSEEHVWQTSMYWHGLRKMGLPMARRIGVFYIPKNSTKRDVVEPVMLEFDPIPAKTIGKVAVARRRRVEEYRKSLPKPNPRPLELEEYLTDALEPVQSRVQKIVRDRSANADVLKLVPHWTAPFCPFPTELCSCSTQGTTTLGMYDETGDYHPRPGYEEIEPELTPEG